MCLIMHCWNVGLRLNEWDFSHYFLGDGMIDIIIGNEVNTLLVNGSRTNGIMTHQHIEINMTFVNHDLFVKALSHEYMHVVLNDIDKTCFVSSMYDNINTYDNNYAVTVVKESLLDKIKRVIKCY